MYMYLSTTDWHRVIKMETKKTKKKQNKCLATISWWDIKSEGTKSETALGSCYLQNNVLQSLFIWSVCICAVHSINPKVNHSTCQLRIIILPPHTKRALIISQIKVLLSTENYWAFSYFSIKTWVHITLRGTSNAYAVNVNMLNTLFHTFFA